MPSKSEVKHEGVNITPKKLAFIIPALVALASTAAGTLYNVYDMARGTARNLEKLQIKDYRQHRDTLRRRSIFLGDAAAVMEAVLEIDPDRFGPNGPLILRQRKEQHSEAKELLENYIEENKHSGAKD